MLFSFLAAAEMNVPPDISQFKKALEELLHFSTKESGVSIKSGTNFFEIASKFQLGNLSQMISLTNMSQPDVHEKWTKDVNDHMDLAYNNSSQSSAVEEAAEATSSFIQDTSLDLEETAPPQPPPASKSKKGKAPFLFDDFFLTSWIETVFMDVLKRADVDPAYKADFDKVFPSSSSSSSSSLMVPLSASSTQLTAYQSKYGQSLQPSSFAQHVSDTEKTVSQCLQDKIISTLSLNNTSSSVSAEKIQSTSDVLLGAVRSIPQALSNTTTAVESFKTTMILFNCLIFCLLCPLKITLRDPRRKRPSALPADAPFFVGCDFPKVTVEHPTPAFIQDCWLESNACPYRHRTALWSKWHDTVLSNQTFSITANTLAGLARVISVSLMPVGLATMESWFLPIITHTSSHGMNKRTVRWLFLVYPILFEGKSLEQQLELMDQIFWDPVRKKRRSWHAFIDTALTDEEKMSSQKPSDNTKALWWAVNQRLEYYNWADEEAYDSATARAESKYEKEEKEKTSSQSEPASSSTDAPSTTTQSTGVVFTDAMTASFNALLQILTPKLSGSPLNVYEIPEAFTGFCFYVLGQSRQDKMKVTSQEHFRSLFKEHHQKWGALTDSVKVELDNTAKEVVNIVAQASSKSFNIWDLPEKVKTNIRKVRTVSLLGCYIDCDKLMKVCTEKYYNKLQPFYQKVLDKKSIAESEFVKWFANNAVQLKKSKLSASESHQSSKGTKRHLNQDNSKNKNNKKSKKNKDHENKKRKRSSKGTNKEDEDEQKTDTDDDDEDNADDDKDNDVEDYTNDDPEVSENKDEANNTDEDEEYVYEEDFVDEQSQPNKPRHQSTNENPSAHPSTFDFSMFGIHIQTLFNRAVKPVLVENQGASFDKFFRTLVRQSGSDNFPYHRTCHGYADLLRYDSVKSQIDLVCKPCNSENGCSDPQHSLLTGVFVNKDNPLLTPQSFYYPAGVSFFDNTSYSIIMTRLEYSSMGFLCPTVLWLPHEYEMKDDVEISAVTSSTATEQETLSSSRSDALLMVSKPGSTVGNINFSQSGQFQFNSCNHQSIWRKDHKDVNSNTITLTYELLDDERITVSKLAIPCDAISVVSRTPSIDLIEKKEVTVQNFSSEDALQDHLKHSSKYCWCCAQKFNEKDVRCCALMLLFPKSHNCCNELSRADCNTFIHSDAGAPFKHIFFHRSCISSLAREKDFVASLRHCHNQIATDKELLHRICSFDEWKIWSQVLPLFSPSTGIPSSEYINLSLKIQGLYSFDCVASAATDDESQNKLLIKVKDQSGQNDFVYDCTLNHLLTKQDLYTDIINSVLIGHAKQIPVFDRLKPVFVESKDHAQLQAAALPVIQDGACAFYTIDVLLGSSYCTKHKVIARMNHTYSITSSTQAKISGKQFILESMSQAIVAMTLDLYYEPDQEVSGPIKRILPFLHFSDFFYDPNESVATFRKSRSKSQPADNQGQPLLYALQHRYTKLLHLLKNGKVKELVGKTMVSFLEFVQLIVSSKFSIRVVLVVGTNPDSSKDGAKYGKFLVLDKNVISMFQAAFEGFLADMNKTYEDVLLTPGVGKNVVPDFPASRHHQELIQNWQGYSLDLYNGSTWNDPDVKYELFVANVSTHREPWNDPSKLSSHNFLSLMSSNNHFDPIVFKIDNKIVKNADTTLDYCSISYDKQTYVAAIDVARYKKDDDHDDVSAARQIVWSLAFQAAARRQEILTDITLNQEHRSTFLASTLTLNPNMSTEHSRVNTEVQQDAQAADADYKASDEVKADHDVHMANESNTPSSGLAVQQLNAYERFQVVSALFGSDLHPRSSVFKLFDRQEKKTKALKTFVCEEQVHDERPVLKWLQSQWNSLVSVMSQDKQQIQQFLVFLNRIKEEVWSFRKNSIDCFKNQDPQPPLDEFIWSFVRRFYLEITVPWALTAPNRGTILFDHYHVDVLTLMEMCHYSKVTQFDQLILDIKKVEHGSKVIKVQTNNLQRSLPFLHFLNQICTQMALCLVLLHQIFPGLVHNDVKLNNFFCNFDSVDATNGPVKGDSREETVKGLGRLKSMVIGDFGLSCHAQDGDSSGKIVSMAGSVNGGTPIFAAPEAFCIDKKGVQLYQCSDIYSLAVSIVSVVCTVEIIQNTFTLHNKLAHSTKYSEQCELSKFLLKALEKSDLAELIFGEKRFQGLKDMLYACKATKPTKEIMEQIRQKRTQGLHAFLDMVPDVNDK